MKYKLITTEILAKLGLKRTSKMSQYIVTCIVYMSENENSFMPITKVLYTDVSKTFNTSNNCVERGIRNAIEKIWKDKNSETEELICNIFGKQFLSKKPTNYIFLASLYDYIKTYVLYKYFDNVTFICPKTGEICKYPQYMKKYFLEIYCNIV